MISRILLSKAASDALSATGERAFAIVHRCMRGVEEPETAGRWCITMAPVEWETAQDASAVLLGTKRAATIRKAKQDDKADPVWTK
jgi:predicted secreted protein